MRSPVLGESSNINTLEVDPILPCGYSLHASEAWENSFAFRNFRTRCVCPSVRLSVCPSVRLSVHSQFSYSYRNCRHRQIFVNCLRWRGMLDRKNLPSFVTYEFLISWVQPFKAQCKLYVPSPLTFFGYYPHSVFMFRVIFRISSNCSPKQHKTAALCDGDAMCFFLRLEYNF
jgi:hypothetical protein